MKFTSNIKWNRLRKGEVVKLRGLLQHSLINIFTSGTCRNGTDKDPNSKENNLRFTSNIKQNKLSRGEVVQLSGL